MKKRILDVGNCGPDFASITRLMTGHFDCVIEQAHGPEDALSKLRSGYYDLVTINRKLDRDYSDGIELLKTIKADAQLSSVPVMLITNYEDHQDAAVELGAKRGFGKLEFEQPETLAKLTSILG